MKKIVLFGFLFQITILAQNISVEYKDIDDPFAGYSAPIDIGILDFEGSTTFEEELYEAMKSNSELIKKFRIYPYKTLEENKAILGLKSLNPNDEKVLKVLLDNFGIKFILCGKFVRNKKIQLKIYETINNTEIYSQNYRSSKNSTPSTDILKLLAENRVAVYKNEVNPEIIQSSYSVIKEFESRKRTYELEIEHAKTYNELEILSSEIKDFKESFIYYIEILNKHLYPSNFQYTFINFNIKIEKKKNEFIQK